MRHNLWLMAVGNGDLINKQEQIWRFPSGFNDDLEGSMGLKHWLKMWVCPVGSHDFPHSYAESLPHF